jgi:drug/metabolite transporter (DMT)-like permease
MEPSRLWPSLAIVVASALWGLYWIPMRELDAVGIEKAWPSLVLNGAVVLVLLPIAVFRWRKFLIDPKNLLLSGASIGFALSLYGVSLNLTEVVRATLLFYLSPAWSTAIGLVWLGERLTARRVGALVLGFAGLMVVLEADQGLPIPRNLGDWMAIVSGMAWSVGSANIFVGRKNETFETGMMFAVGTAAATGVLIAVFGPSTLGAMPSPEALFQGLPVLGVAIFVLMMPILFLTVWGAKRLPPATVGILLLGEIVVAVVSAALLLDEPFGARQVIGAVLIAGAGVLEVLPRRRRPAYTPDGGRREDGSNVEG